jgi:hypothetical protein
MQPVPVFIPVGRIAGMRSAAVIRGTESLTFMDRGTVLASKSKGMADRNKERAILAAVRRAGYMCSSRQRDAVSFLLFCK